MGQETINFLAEKISKILFFQQFFEEKLLMCYHVLGQECVAYKVLNSKMESRKNILNTDFFLQFFEEKLVKCYHVLGQECVAYKVLNSKKFWPLRS